MYMDNATKEIMGKERVHRTRVTVLQSSGKVRGRREGGREGRT